MKNQWQEECTKKLEECILSGPDGASKWQKFKSSKWPKRIIIADVNLSSRRISGYDLSYCYLVRVILDNSNISDCNFSYSIFRNCTANGANVEGANFRSVDMKEDGLELKTHKFDDSTRFLVEPNNLPYALHPGLRSMAAQACAARDWRYKRSRSLLARFFLYITGNGYSLKRMPFVGGVILVLFTVIFTLVQDCKIALNDRFIIGIRYSIGYFLNINSFEADKTVFFIGSFESFLGIMFFSILTAVLVTMLFGKA
ncbi:pentapeptide repeat-containing protein [Novosphingobium sp.]|uniref:pentapeptide repeat-containing protein n=1 Tax=Novosphingobium sp. TaxID=1874826 RepID=UPI003BAC9626